MKISVIDSGLGGILFAENFKKEVEYASISLLIDSEGFPYGNKELNWLKERLIKLVEETQTKVVFIACNTLSSLIFYYNLTFNKIVVDVITPTIYFLKKCNYKHIAILATTNTIRMNIFDRLLSVKVCYIDATELIYVLEAKEDYHFPLSNIIKSIPPNCDALVLGCTHLIMVKEDFRECLNTEVISQDEIFISFFQNV